MRDDLLTNNDTYTEDINNKDSDENISESGLTVPEDSDVQVDSDDGFEVVPVNDICDTVNEVPKKKRFFLVVILLLLLLVIGGGAGGYEYYMHTCLKNAVESIKFEEYGSAKKELAKINRFSLEYKQAKNYLKYISDVEKTETLMQNADALLVEGKYEDALKIVEEADVIVTELRKQNFNNSMKAKLDEKANLLHSKIAIQKAELNIQQQNFDEAMKYTEEALSYVPDSAEGKELKARIENYKKAINCVEAARKAFDSDKLDEAYENIENALKFVPDFAPAINLKKEIDNYAYALQLFLQAKNYWDNYNYEQALECVNNGYNLSAKAKNQYGALKTEIETAQKKYNEIMENPLKISEKIVEWGAGTKDPTCLKVTYTIGNYAPKDIYYVKVRIRTVYKNAVLGERYETIQIIPANYQQTYTLYTQIDQMSVLGKGADFLMETITRYTNGQAPLPGYIDIAVTDWTMSS